MIGMMRKLMKTRMISLAIAVLIVPLAGATKCQSVTAQAPAAAPAGGGSVYLGVHPPLRAGSWAKVKTHTWHFVAYAALAAALAHEGQRIVLSEQADAQTPAQEVELTIHTPDGVSPSVGYTTLCSGKPETYILATWKLPDGKKLDLDCLSVKRIVPPKFREIIDCLTRIMSIVNIPVSQYDGLFGSKVNIWRFGKGGEVITLSDDTIYSVGLPSHVSWKNCADGWEL
jgi:hypothetical protein